MSTISEKILSKSSNQEMVSAGDFVKANVDVALNHLKLCIKWEQKKFGTQIKSFWY